MVALYVDGSVLHGEASGVAVYLKEILAALPEGFSVTLRPTGAGPSKRRRFLRKIPGAYALRALRLGWPPIPRDAVFWAPNFLLPSWPLVPANGVVTIHDTIFIDSPEWADATRGAFLRAHLGATLRRARNVIVPSAHVAERLRAMSPTTRFSVIPHGVRRLSAPPVPRHTILCIGNIEPRKGTRVLFDAYRALPDALQRAHPLVIAGAVHDAAYAAGLPIVSRPSDASLAHLLAEAALVVAPSFAEGFGFVPLEAYVAGAPVLASDLAVTREWLGDRIDYFPAGDAMALREKIAALVKTPRLPKDMDGIAARFTWRAAAEAHARVFAEAALAR